MNVYVNVDVEMAVQLYSGLCYPIPTHLTVRDFMRQAAEQLYEAHWSGLEAAAIPIKNWHPELAGLPHEEILSAPFAITDAQQTIAREYGFGGWSAVEKLGKRRFDEAFEAAVDAVVMGDVVQLQAALAQEPLLITQVSSFGHRATLLHYTAANGVETWRQQVPYNVVDVAQILLAAGADPLAKMQVYGGAYTARELVETSVHPAAVGVGSGLSQLLLAAE